MNLGVGIDFGSTCSAIARVNEQGQPKILCDGDGNAITPSLIFCDPPHFVVGEVARRSILNDNARIAHFSMAQLGTSERINIQGQDYKPEFLATVLMRKMVQDAETAGDEPVRHAVLSVPVHFSKKQREMLKSAARKAGIEVLDLIDDCVAAALYHGASIKDSNRTFLVYDLGGTTFQASVLRLIDGALKVVAIGGYRNLGATAWDERLMRQAVEFVRTRYGCDVDAIPEAMAELRSKAEAAKRQLSTRLSTGLVVNIPIKHAGMDLYKNVQIERIEMSRERFEASTRDLLELTKVSCDVVLEMSGETWKSVEVIAAGGGSWMCAVRTMLKENSGREIKAGVPDRCIAKGCALHAARLSMKNLRRSRSASK